MHAATLRCGTTIRFEARQAIGGSFFVKFTRTWPSVGDLAAADDGDVMAAWAGLGYYARARNLLKCARVVADE
ncbi:MAG: hypothetical protein KC429_10740, partial [Planktomarina temperata]|nr:hypothetical protein [Planktomarina temperata]